MGVGEGCNCGETCEETGNLAKNLTFKVSLGFFFRFPVHSESLPELIFCIEVGAIGSRNLFGGKLHNHFC